MLPAVIRLNISSLDMDQLGELDDWLHVLMGSAAHVTPESPGRPAATIVTNLGTYQLERVKCGKARCRCALGLGHGPYWYHYFVRNGKKRSRYVGKTLNIGVINPQETKTP